MYHLSLCESSMYYIYIYTYIHTHTHTHAHTHAHAHARTPYTIHIDTDTDITIFNDKYTYRVYTFTVWLGLCSSLAGFYRVS